MNSELPVSFFVRYRRTDFANSNASYFVTGQVIIEHYTSYSPLIVLRLYNEKTKVNGPRILLTDFKKPTFLPTGTKITLTSDKESITFDFSTHEMMKLFFEIFKRFMDTVSSSSSSTSTSIQSISPPPSITSSIQQRQQQQSPRRSPRNESRVQNLTNTDSLSSHMIDANLLMNGDEQSENGAPSSTGKDEPINFLEGLETLANGFGYSQTYVPHSRRMNGGGVGIVKNIPIRIEKENQHKTPVKPSTQQNTTRSPLSALAKTESTPKKFAANTMAPFAQVIQPPLLPNTARSAFLHGFPSASGTKVPMPQTTSQSYGARQVNAAQSQKRNAATEPPPQRTKRMKYAPGGDHGFKSQLSTISERPQFRGFANIGNTCYMNSILQAIFALDPFAKELHKCFTFFNEHIPSAFLFHSLPQLLGVKDTDNQDLKTQLLLDVKNAISSSAKRFMGNAQHDAHELLSQVLDQLKEEINKLSANRTLAFSCPPNPVQSNFEFSVSHRTECQSCHEATFNEEIYMDLSLDLPFPHPPGDISLQLQPLLNSYFKDEAVDSKCEKCGFERADRSHKFKKLPRILTLHLKRYSFNSAAAIDEKLGTKIAFPRYLNLQRLCEENMETSAVLSESTKKYVIPNPLVTPTPSNVDADSARPTEKNERARRALFTDKEAADAVICDDNGNEYNTQSFNYPRSNGIYNTRAAARGGPSTSYTGFFAEDEDAELKAALERSKVETGPPVIDVDFDEELQEAMFRSLTDADNQSNYIEAPDKFEFGEPESTKRFVEEVLDPETIKNSEDGHLPLSYQLCGVVNHLGGGTGKGHYVSDAYHFETRAWRYYNDTDVKLTSEETVRRDRQKTVYVFFYVAKEVLDEFKALTPGPGVA